MLSKKTFVQILEMIQYIRDYDAEMEAQDVVLQDSHPIFRLERMLLEALEEDTEDPTGVIDDYIYLTDFGRCKGAHLTVKHNGYEYEVKDADTLYNVLFGRLTQNEACVDCGCKPDSIDKPVGKAPETKNENEELVKNLCDILDALRELI